MTTEAIAAAVDRHVADADTPISADEDRALDLLLSFNQEQLELMLVILDQAFGHEN